MQLPPFFAGVRLPARFRRRRLRWLIGLLAVTVATVFIVVWQVPTVRQTVISAGQQGKDFFVSNDPTAAPVFQDSPAPTPDTPTTPSPDLGQQIRDLQSATGQLQQRVAVAEKEVQDEHDLNQQIQSQLKDAVTTLSQTNDLLNKEAQMPIVTTASSAPADATSSTSDSGKVTSTSEKVHLNSATLADLETLPGIGPTYAGRIVDYRTQNGPFASVDDLMNVSGIKDSVMGKIRDYIDL